ncbi:short-chain dehydrogenase [Actinoplanes sp. SE50]|uniref:SDR family oxidoreductase n=1 Tax=unclassified Actinoplanes TaxID=2626549 RepID=UPI00023EBD54|nr:MULTISPECIES: SDR family oxidoreductase [unclassified Actinoplanes]AEV85082.1 short chain dehydrogenase [Actinoplanes sp. SE50/110]ATO83473.1 short-chain dehydrogenase [Actinoplanes sp. SE50]SLM00880.1 SDR family oxidoreductase [Actinoplanes sp. SE50/110]
MVNSIQRYPEMQDQVAVVTGAASGIGAAVARDFAAQGCHVALLDADRPALFRLVDALADEVEGALRPIEVDVSDPDAVRSAVGDLTAGWGAISYLVNCTAGLVAAGAHAANEQWDRALAVNVRSAAMLLGECVPHMMPGSAAVHTASIAAREAQPLRWIHDAAKGAIFAMTRCQAFDLAPRGIRVNLVSPGWMGAPEGVRPVPGDGDAGESAWGVHRILPRAGQPCDVARAVLFLCSEDASFISGTEMMVDGGYSVLSAASLRETSRVAGAV